MDEYIIKYEHGGKFTTDGTYVNGEISEVSVDPDKLSYWDLLGDAKDLGYEILRTINMYYFHEGKLIKFWDDAGIGGLIEQLEKLKTVTVFVEALDTLQDKPVPEGLLDQPEALAQAHDAVDHDGSCTDDEELLLAIEDVNEDVDDEREDARENMKKYVELKKAVGDGSQPTNTNTESNGRGYVGGYTSDYFDSSDPGSYEDTSEGSSADDAKRHKSRKKYYHPDHPLHEFQLGLSFQDLKLFKKELVEFATRKGFEFKYIKNDAVRVRATCSAKGCGWLILCSWCSKENRFVVKHYASEHSCLLGVTRNKRVTATVVAKRFGEVISSMPFIRPRHLKAMVRKELGVFITTKTCRNAKRLVLQMIEKQFKEDFKVLNNYALELETTNPGSTVHVVSERKRSDELPTFRKIYICLKAVKEGFLNGCRRLIGVDGCFLKGILKGIMLVAVGRDGNNQMFPIAWAIVEKETTESWSWFITHLKEDLSIDDGLGWSVVSDMQKGLIHAVNELLPLIEHRMCARHIYARWGKTHQGKALQYQFWTIARSTSQPEMQKQLNKMRNMIGGEKAVADLLEKWPISGWCQAYFNDIVKCEVIDNNMCETFNGVILQSRSKPIITMLDDIRQYVMLRIAGKKEFVMQWNTICGPNIVAKVDREKKKSSNWQVEWNGSASHEVFRDDWVMQVRESFVVMLGNNSCSCGKWDKSGIPCEHSLAVILFNGADPIEYVADWFKKDTYCKAYNSVINPVKGRDFWPVSVEGPLLPPTVKKMPGRPAKKRKKEPLEARKSNTKLSRHGRVFRCQVCHQVGHNSRRCSKISAPSDTPQEHASQAPADGNNSSRGKKKTNASTYGPFQMIRGSHTGESIVGREVSSSAKFMTTGEILAERHWKSSTSRNQDKGPSQQSSTALDPAEFPTQGSTTSHME